MGALTDWGTLPSLPRCSDERRDWIAAGCDHHSLRQSNRCTRPGKAAAMAGSPSSRAALNVPSMALVPSIGHRGARGTPGPRFHPYPCQLAIPSDVSTSESKPHFWRCARWQRCASRHSVLQIGDGGCSEHPPTQF